MSDRQSEDSKSGTTTSGKAPDRGLVEQPAGASARDAELIRDQAADVLMWVRASRSRLVKDLPPDIDLEDVVQESVVVLSRLPSSAPLNRPAALALLKRAVLNRLIDYRRRTYTPDQDLASRVVAARTLAREPAFREVLQRTLAERVEHESMDAESSVSSGGRVLTWTEWLNSPVSRASVIQGSVLAVSIVSFFVGLLGFSGSYFGAGLTFGGALLAYEAAYVLFRHEKDSGR